MPIKSPAILSIIFLLSILVAGEWEVKLSSGEKFKNIRNMRLEKTTLLLALTDDPQALPIPVYLGDVHTIKRIRFNRFLTGILGGYLGWLAGAEIYHDWQSDLSYYQVDPQQIQIAGTFGGWLFFRKIAVVRLRLHHRTLKERLSLVRELLWRESYAWH